MATRPTTTLQRPRGPGRTILVTAALLFAIAALVAAHRHHALRAPLLRSVAEPALLDPFAYHPGRDERYVVRAIAGESPALFSASPGGAIATAARVAQLRGLIDRATAGSGIDPNLLEGLVFVESAGRPDAIAGGDPSGAAGLTQILPGTATMEGLNVDVGASRQLTAQIAAAQGNGAPAATVAGLERRRARVDQRFDPVQALGAAVRYLEQARARFGLQDLAFVSYHMGQGNLESVLAAYDGGTAVPYPQLYFDSGPRHHGSAYALLSGFSDQSWLYYWRVLGAAALMRLYRSDRSQLERLMTLQGEADGGAAVLHPPSTQDQFSTPQALESAYSAGTLVPLPSNAAQLGLSYSPAIGELAGRLHAPQGLYRGLRPQARTVLLELAEEVRALAHGQQPLVVSAAVTDGRYQQLLGLSDPPAAQGWSFTVERRYVSDAQAVALQEVLERLQALNVIAWTRYSSEIEVTVASDATDVLAAGP